MKQLFAGVVILLVVGIAGFLYRNTLEHPLPAVPPAPAPMACATDAKVCPDGSAVGRSGPDCQFAACPFPNVELASAHIAFAAPAGYVENTDALGNDPTLLAAFDKIVSGATDSIVVRDYAIPAGQTATSTMLASTMFESSGMTATSMSQLPPKIVNAKTFYCATLERFEGQVHTACYLPRATDVLRFEVLEKGVTDWTDPKLDVDALPEHQAFSGMLATFSVQ